ncbi:expressed unknown protein [Ectocarpus siliculosus]|uniref:Bulb-type lectin domain-containing protein n=1 Tax=Ectocarpus siliculosus TaxID=2880 RepID=D7G6H1_ECTSI|nr:expressed unknown protein [Ectocarpus siliculosus]|eukprot:CBJ27556.1 expressed unknown protein [Ectocarpus siliculosus]
MATAGCMAWARVTSDLHPLRAAGYLILSVEALTVTFWWPRLYPPAGRKRSESSARHRRQHRRSRHLSRSGSADLFGGATPSPTINGQRSNTNGGKASSRWSGDSSGWWESEGGLEGLSEAGRSSAPSSLVSIGGRRRRAARLQSGQSGGGGFLGEEPLETFPEKRSAVDGDMRVPLPPKSRMRYARPVLIVLLTLSASYLTTWLLLSISSARVSTAVDEDAMSSTRDIVAMKKGAEMERRTREEREEGARRMELEEKALREAVAAKEARQKQREAERRKDLERKALADAEEKRLEEARALREKQQREQRAREEQRARDEKRAKDEQAARLREQKAREERKSRDAAAAKAKAKLEAEQRRKRAKMAATLEQTRSIGLEDALSNGSTELRVMPNGDLVLADNGRPVWTARGSKKRRSLVGWIWRKIRRQQAELREEGKLLWSGGQRQKKARQKKRRTTQQRKRVPSANDREGADGSDMFRLIVTDDGNAILEREGSEVVWKALDR